MTTTLRKAHGPKVVLVEGDLMFGDLATMVGLRPDRSMLDVLDRPRPWTPNIVSRAVTHHPILDFDVVLAPSESHYAEKVTSRAFADILDALLLSHDFVIVDVATAMGDREIEIFDRAAAIYLLSSPDPVTLTSTRKMIRVFSLLRDPIKKMAVLSNDAPCSQDKITHAQLEAGLGAPIARRIPRGKVDEFDYQSLRTLEPFSPWGEAQRAICEFTRELRNALWTGQPAPGIQAGQRLSNPSFNPYVAVAGKDLSTPPGASPQEANSGVPPVPIPAPVPAPSQASTESSATPEAPVQTPEAAREAARKAKKERLRKTLTERLRISRAIKTEGLPKEIRDPNAVPPPPAPREAPASKAVPLHLPGADPRKRQIGEINILVGDDNVNFRTGLCRALGFEDRLRVIAEAGDGKEVLDLVTVHQPQAVLLDANMPRLSGLHAASSIKKLLPQTVILIMSVQGDKAFIQKAMDSGADHFLTKPFDPEDVSRLLNKFFPQ
jgi:CheY-like chemotaxis protein